MKATNQYDSVKDHQPIEATKTICVLQLTRIGDILQTYQAAELFKEQYPQYRLILVARKRFARPLSFLLQKIFCKIYYLDRETFSLKTSESLKEVLFSTKSLLENLKNENISVLINLSFSKSSGYLTALIPAEHKMGLAYDNFNTVVLKDKWSQFIYSNVMGGALNPFSLIDIYKSMFGPGIKNKPRLQKLFTKVSSIVIHPFASHEKKMWKSSKWEEIIYQILKNHPEITIFVVGNKKEQMESEAIVNSALLQKYRNQLQNLVGKTTIEELYSLLGKTDLFIGHDSMTGHLASIQNIPTVTIALGTVRPRETTPYGENNYVLSPQTSCYPCFPQDKCELYQCHFDIPYQIIYSAINEFIKTGSITKEYQLKNNSCFHLNSVNIYRSKITAVDFYQLDSILDEKNNLNDTFSTLYRICWQFIINNTEEAQNFISLTNKSHQALLACLNGLQHLYQLSDFGRKYSRYILEEISSQIPRLEKIRDYSEKIDEIDSLSKIVKQTNPYLAPIIDYYTVQKGNLKGTNVVEITESSFLLYNDYVNTISVVYELIEKNIAEHKNKNKITEVLPDYKI